MNSSLVGAEWEADIEGVPLLWDEGKGWRLMTDEEYKSMMWKSFNAVIQILCVFTKSDITQNISAVNF